MRARRKSNGNRTLTERLGQGLFTLDALPR